MTPSPALLAEIQALDVASAYGPLPTPGDALDVLHDIATDQSPFESEREALLWCAAVALAGAGAGAGAATTGPTMLSTLLAAAEGWTEEEIEAAINGVAVRRARP